MKRFWKSLEALRAAATGPSHDLSMEVDGQDVRIALVRNHRAKRYILRITGESSARVTLPRHGTFRFAREFVRCQQDWIAREIRQFRDRFPVPRDWQVGSRILLRGNFETIRIAPDGSDAILLGTEKIFWGGAQSDLRSDIEFHLRRLAHGELPGWVQSSAVRHGVAPRRITIRNQKTRWGSCSARGTISLNWRLIQCPDAIRDYVILHELMHLRELNHSRRFWNLVAKACPEYRIAEDWLKKHTFLMTE